MNLVNASIVHKVTCKCTSKHVPNPTKYFSVEFDGHTEYLCPTTALNLEGLLIEYKRYAGEVPGSVLKRYSHFVRRLARDLATW